MVKKGRRHGGGTDLRRSNIDDSLLLENDDLRQKIKDLEDEIDDLLDD